MMRLDEPKLMLSAHADAAGDVPATADGFFMQKQRKEDQWELRFQPYEKAAAGDGEGTPVAEIDSTCDPTEKVLNPQSVLVLSCPPGHNDRYVAVVFAPPTETVGWQMAVELYLAGVSRLSERRVGRNLLAGGQPAGFRARAHR